MSGETNWLEFFEDQERRHADFYLDFARQHARRDVEAYDRLEADSGNLLKIASWLTVQNETTDVLNLAEALWQQSDFLRSRGFMQRGLPLLEQARQAACKLGDLRAEFIWLEALAHIHFSSSNFDLARPLYEQVLALAQEIDEPGIKAQANLGMGRLLMDMGDLPQSADLLKQALQEYRQIQDEVGEITTLTALGNLLSLQGNFVEAVVYLEQGLPLAQARQDRHSEAELRYALGYAAALAQNWSTAVTHFEVAVEIARDIGDRFFENRGLTALGEARLARGEVQQAIDLLEKALTYQETSDDILSKTFTHFYLAKAYNVRNEPNLSLLHLQEIYPYLLETRQNLIMGDLAVKTAWLMVDNYLRQGQTDLAQTTLQDVLQLGSKAIGNSHQAAEALLKAIERGEI